MEQKTSNESVRPILLIISFAATKLVAVIVLRFIYLPACSPFFSSSLHSAFKDEISRWIF